MKQPSPKVALARRGCMGTNEAELAEGVEPESAPAKIAARASATLVGNGHGNDFGFGFATPVPTSIGPEVELPLGEIIPGTRYRAISRLGEGGMGVVYLA